MSFTSRSSSRSSISPFRSRNKPSQQPPPPDHTTRRTKPHSSKPHISPATHPISSTKLSHSPASAKLVKENVTVTVRLRPLNSREIGKGDEVAWIADGDYSIQNEFNPAIAYGFDRVFGPATTTRHVYDVAAQHVVNGAMEGVNGTVFAYGVTSSGKTHTMHGEQKSPGIIPLAVKDVFGIIQETPGREFLLRVSYLEIYNEVINDLLDPTGQNLRIREDSQGTYVEGIKEEVVLSPAHALSLIASGEAHRHVGSNNFNLLSSRSHTIFTLMIESSPCGGNLEEEVTLSQLHLIDLAGSESSKTETTGMRRKEGSYINKSLLTLGTVISKLTDGKSAHIPYRDSKLTRLLQSSLSGHGRVSLICTVTPASSNTEETHNTLKFAHRSKHVEIKASQNKIVDEKSLIKKYQKEISSLKQELQQLKRGMMENSYMMAPNQEDLVNMKLQLEAGQVKLQSRLEEEEQAKAALMGRIQRLTKLILVSTKNTMAPNIPENPDHRRRHSFGEDELVYLPEKKRGIFIDDDDDVGSIDSEALGQGKSDLANLDELVKDYRKNRRKGMLGWFKLKKPDHLSGLSPHIDHESSTSGSPTSSRSSKSKTVFSDMRDGMRNSVGRKVDDLAVGDLLLQRTQAGDLFSAAASGRRLPPTGTTITDQMDLIHEQVKMLSGDVALCTSSLKRLSEQAANRPEDLQLQEQMQKLKYEIKGKKSQIRLLEQRMISSVEMNPHNLKNFDTSQVTSKLVTQLNEKTFELEIKTADNRILQDQLQVKISENAEMQQTILLLRQQLESRTIDNNLTPQQTKYICEEKFTNESTPTSVISLNKVFSQEDSIHGSSDTFLNSQLLKLAAEIEALKKEKVQITEEKDDLMICSQKLADEGSYAKELAAAAAVELRNLAAEVTKLSYQNAKLKDELAVTKQACQLNLCQSNDFGSHQDVCVRKPEDGLLVEELQKELNARYQREASLVGALSERDKLESELRKRLDAAKRHEEDMEAELANMWALVAKLKNPASSEDILADETSTVHCNKIFMDDDETQSLNELRLLYDKEKERCQELERIVSRLKGENIADLDIKSLEELQNLNVEAITKICHAKASYR